MFRLVISVCARKLLTKWCNVLTNFRASGKQVHDERFIKITGRMDLCKWVWSRRDCSSNASWFNQLFTRFVSASGITVFCVVPGQKHDKEVAVFKESNEEGKHKEVHGDDGLKNSRIFGKTSTTEMAARTAETTAWRSAT